MSTFKLDFFNPFIFKILSITIFREITLKKVSLEYDISLISKNISSFEQESRILNFGLIFMQAQQGNLTLKVDSYISLIQQLLQTDFDPTVHYIHTYLPF